MTPNHPTSAFMLPAGARILRRRCSVCGQKKRNLWKCWDFTKDTPTHLHDVCRRCEYREANKDAIAAHQREYREAKKRKRLIGLRTIQNESEQARLLRQAYGHRSVAAALGIKGEPS